MQVWRIIATALLAVAGIVLVLIIMAKARERTGNAGQVALAGAITFTALLVIGVLTLTVLNGALVWTISIGVTALVSVLLLAS